MTRAGGYTLGALFSDTVPTSVAEWLFFMRRQRRPFLANPFWRDWLLGLVLFGTGVVLGDAAIVDRGAKCALLLAEMLLIAGTAILAAAVIHAMWRMLGHQRTRLQEQRAVCGLCPACGYDLRASTDRCPECGMPTPKATTGNSQPGPEKNPDQPCKHQGEEAKR